MQTEQINYEETIQKAADWVVSHKLEAPAVLFLELNKPISFITSQFTIVAAPFLAPIFGMERLMSFSGLISSADRVEAIIAAIEDKCRVEEIKT